ncbi:MAG: 4Fe-4S dicluster domain-containing protein [Clostridiales bacterium]|jgi:predicted aldo/keto reductase-like oxidoreductase|nr:aldo/keto reductase [Bacillota bacterium]NLL54746.1 4Fe-4S dicluster domain-containing protein [Clostridiales bacterium]
MICREFKGLKLSSLGFGCMRLPILEGNSARIDETRAREMIDLAIRGGVNYFDTAWGYHGGTSEPFMGKVLSAYPRSSYYLATKFPGYDLDNMDKAHTIFPRQLQRLNTDSIDFYLLHNVCEQNIDAYLDEKRYGVFSYLKEQKQKGRIRHLGFSCHCTMDTFRRYLDAWGDDMEFCQIQLNWLDWSFQDAKAKVELLRELGIPVWVMEPVRGGRLARLTDTAEAKLRALRPDESMAAWAFRFVQDLPEVKVILSGMSTLDQVQENLNTFSRERPLGPEERKALFDIAGEMSAVRSLACTNCRYCVEYCPKELDIPQLIDLYNKHAFHGARAIPPDVLASVDPQKGPGACLGCGACSAVCPQQIDIPGMMSDFAARLE